MRIPKIVLLVTVLCAAEARAAMRYVGTSEQVFRIGSQLANVDELGTWRADLSFEGDRLTVNELAFRYSGEVALSLGAPTAVDVLVEVPPGLSFQLQEPVASPPGIARLDATPLPLAGGVSGGATAVLSGLLSPMEFGFAENLALVNHPLWHGHPERNVWLSLDKASEISFGNKLRRVHITAPILEMLAVPEPSTWMLLAFGVAVMLSPRVMCSHRGTGGKKGLERGWSGAKLRAAEVAHKERARQHPPGRRTLV